MLVSRLGTRGHVSTSLLSGGSIARKMTRKEGPGEGLRGIPNFHPHLEGSGHTRLKF